MPIQHASDKILKMMGEEETVKTLNTLKLRSLKYPALC